MGGARLQHELAVLRQDNANLSTSLVLANAELQEMHGLLASLRTENQCLHAQLLRVSPSTYGC